MLLQTSRNQSPYIKKNGGGSICVPAPFQYPRNKCFRSTYFGLTRNFPQPIGLRTSRSRCIIPVGGIILPHRSLSVERENLLSCCRAASSLIALYFKRSRVRCLTIPVSVKCLSRNDARQLLRERWRRGNRQLKLI